MEIRYGQARDLGWLSLRDVHVDADWIRRCLTRREYLLAWDGPSPTGFLRFSLFWGRIPYLDMIVVEPPVRNQGIGRRLLAVWERDMAQRGATALLTSAMSDEPEPQAWHQRNGYRPCSQLTFGPAQQTPEVFFVKDLTLAPAG